jgi:SAM-dependent methyltransferase
MVLCPLCRQADLAPLPLYLPQAMRSDGLILPEPLRKDACPACGALIGRNTQPVHPYKRSDGQGAGDIARHARVAQGLAAQMARLDVRGPVLEVGAASFQTALHLARAYPDLRIVAVEPEPESLPDTTGIEVHLAPFEHLHWQETFGLIYSNHVMEHVPDTRALLAGIAQVLARDGVALISCPSGLVPSHELLFLDHLYHFTPHAVAVAAQDVGLALVESLPTPWEPLSRLFVLRHGQARLPAAAPDLTPARRSYLAAWEQAEEALLPQLGDAPILFGAGEFSQLIRAYLPRVYDRINRITVDQLVGIRAFDKPVAPLSELDLRGRVMVLGVHPANTAALRARLAGFGAERVLTVPLPDHS